MDAQREQPANSKPPSIRKDGSARIAGSSDWLVRCAGCGARVRDSWLGRCPACRRDLCGDCLPQEERAAKQPCLLCAPTRERPSVAAQRILAQVRAGGVSEFTRPEDAPRKIGTE